MATYFVDQVSGSDSNNGTASGTAWKTVAKVNGATFAAGDTISFKRGCTWREQLTVNQSGTAGNVITYTAYGTGATPIITGCDLLPTWTLDSGSIYKATYSNGITTQLLMEDGTPATLVASKAAIVSAGQFFDDGAGNVYYWATDSASPATHLMEIGGRYNCISGDNKSYITISNLRLYGAGGQFGAGFKAQSSASAVSNITLDSCEFDHSFYSGVWFVYGTGIAAANNLTVTNSTMHHNYTAGIKVSGESASFLVDVVTISGNHIFRNGNATTGLHGFHPQFVNHLTFTHNEVDHNIGHLDWSSGVYLDTAINATITYNHSHDNTWDNFHFDVNSNNFVCAFNISHGASHQGYMIEEHRRANGTSLLCNNLSYNDVASLYFGPGGTFFVVTGVTVVNNIFINGVSRAVGIDVNKTGASASDYFDNSVDYNLYYAPSASGALMQTVDFGGGRTSYTLATWRTLTGWDAHSINADAKFANYDSAGLGNYQLAYGSPAIGKGTKQTITTDYNGNALPAGQYWDLGPFAFRPRGLAF